MLLCPFVGNLGCTPSKFSCLAGPSATLVCLPPKKTATINTAAKKAITPHPIHAQVCTLSAPIALHPLGHNAWSAIALMANSAKARAKDTIRARMAISHHRGVRLQSEYLFHDCFPPPFDLPEPAKASVTAITFWRFFSANEPHNDLL
jgi:hypothetical protein